MLRGICGSVDTDMNNGNSLGFLDCDDLRGLGVERLAPAQLARTPQDRTN